MPEIYDRVKQTATASGVGAFSLGAAADGYRTFADASATGKAVYYAAEQGSAWEVGIGTLTSGTPWTLSRDMVLSSSNAGAKVSFTAGDIVLFCTRPAESGNFATRYAFGSAALINHIAINDDDGGAYACGVSGTSRFIAKTGALGSHEWRKELVVGSTSTAVAAVDSTADGDVIVTGSCASVGGNDVLIAKASEAGALLWQKSLSASNYSELCYSTKVASDGSIYAVGSLSAVSVSDSGLIVKLTSSGAVSWSKKLSISGSGVLLLDCAVGAEDSLYVVGSAIVSSVNRNFVAKVSSAGALLWQRYFSNVSSGLNKKCVIGDSDSVITSGYSASGTNLVAKYSAAGSLIWQRNLGIGELVGGCCYNNGTLFLSAQQTVSGKNVFCLVAVDPGTGTPISYIKGGIPESLRVGGTNVAADTTLGRLMCSMSAAGDLKHYLFSVPVDFALGRGFSGLPELSLSIASDWTDSATTFTDTAGTTSISDANMVATNTSFTWGDLSVTTASSGERL